MQRGDQEYARHSREDQSYQMHPPAVQQFSPYSTTSTPTFPATCYYQHQPYHRPQQEEEEVPWFKEFKRRRTLPASGYGHEGNAAPHSYPLQYHYPQDGYNLPSANHTAAATVEHTAPWPPLPNSNSPPLWPKPAAAAAAAAQERSPSPVSAGHRPLAGRKPADPRVFTTARDNSDEYDHTGGGRDHAVSHLDVIDLYQASDSDSSGNGDCETLTSARGRASTNNSARVTPSPQRSAVPMEVNSPHDDDDKPSSLFDQHRRGAQKAAARKGGKATTGTDLAALKDRFRSGLAMMKQSAQTHENTLDEIDL